MSELVAVALIAGALPAAVAIYNRWQDGIGQTHALRADEQRAEAERQYKTTTWRQERRAAARERQADAVRDWVRDQIATSIDAYYLASVAKGEGEFAANAKEAVQRLIASRGDLDAMSLTRVIVGLSSPDVISALRALTGFVHGDLQARTEELAGLLAGRTTTAPDLERAYTAVTAVGEELDQRVAGLNRLLEAYCDAADA